MAITLPPRRDEVLRSAAPTLASASEGVEGERLTRRELDDPVGVVDPTSQGCGVGVEGREVGCVDAAPVLQKQRCSGMSRESPGAQTVPSGVWIQNPQQSSIWKTRSLAPGESFCQAWSAGVTVTWTCTTVKRSPMSWPVDGKPSARIKVSTYRVEWNAAVTGASWRQVGTL